MTFKVVVSGYPQPSLQWYHDNKEIATDYSREVDDNGNLYLPSCEKWHGGEYKLVAKNSSASVDKRVQLTVLSEAEAPPAKDVDLSPVPVMEFGSFVANNHKNNNAGFKDLYEVCHYRNTQCRVTFVLHVYYTCATCVLHVYYMCATCVLHVCYMCEVVTVYLSQVYSCTKPLSV